MTQPIFLWDAPAERLEERAVPHLHEDCEDEAIAFCGRVSMFGEGVDCTGGGEGRESVGTFFSWEGFPPFPIFPLRWNQSRLFSGAFAVVMKSRSSIV